MVNTNSVQLSAPGASRLFWRKAFAVLLSVVMCCALAFGAPASANAAGADERAPLSDVSGASVESGVSAVSSARPSDQAIDDPVRFGSDVEELASTEQTPSAESQGIQDAQLSTDLAATTGSAIPGGAEAKPFAVSGSASLKKVDADNPATTLAGAVFKLEYNSNGDWVVVPGCERLTTDAQGLIDVDGLALGEYRFVEIEAPADYELNETPIQFVVDGSSTEPVGLVFPNEKSPVLGDVVLKKVDADDPASTLSGAVFRLEQRAADGSWAAVAGCERLVADAGGIVSATGLPLGSYRFVEIEAPAGYELDSTPLEFEITADYTVPIQLTFANTKTPTPPAPPTPPAVPPAADKPVAKLATTGDAASTALVSALALAALGGAGVFAARRKRR